MRKNEMGIKVVKRIHKGYEEFIKVKEKFKELKLRQLFGKYQYIFSSKKGEISLIELKGYDFVTEKDLWEIYELSNNRLFEDVKRFKTKEEAVKRIKELLK